uniref:Uncharacterized protein n=1 Tax=Anguilla anguilla TaxID=7936 RepID=A0A0E9QQD5_ANGAN
MHACTQMHTCMYTDSNHVYLLWKNQTLRVPGLPYSDILS